MPFFFIPGQKSCLIWVLSSNMFFACSGRQQFFKEIDYVRGTNKVQSPFDYVFRACGGGIDCYSKHVPRTKECVSRANTNTFLKGNLCIFVFIAEETLRMPIARKFYYPPITPILTQLSIVSLQKKYFPNTWINCKRVRRTFRLTEDLCILARP